MKTSNKKKWLKVIEFAVVGLATWFISWAEISGFSLTAPRQPDCSHERSRRSETAEQRQFLVFSLKLCFQVLEALQQDDDQPQGK